MRIELIGPTELRLSQVEDAALRIVEATEGEGFGAIAMLAASLAACSAGVLRTWAANVAEVAVAGLTLDVTWSYAERPHRVASYELVIHWPELPAERRDVARRVAATCPVHRTLERGAEIATALEP